MGARKFIDLTDPRLVQHPDKKLKAAKSPLLMNAEMKKAQESVAAKIHASKAKKTLERCNSANVKEELFRKVNNSKPAKPNNDLQQNPKATTYSQLQLLRKKANEEQSNKKNLL